jgi:hypothetical protein
MFVEHAEEAIVGSRLALVIPLLSVMSYLVSVVKLKSQQRIDNLGETISINSRILTAREMCEP